MHVLDLVPEQHRDAASVIVDDHPIVRKGLTALINDQPDMTVCGESDTAAGGLDRIRHQREGTGSRSECWPGHQSRCPVDRLSVRTQLLLDRLVCRRRVHRADCADADEHGVRSSLLEHSVHRLGRCLGQCEPAHRDRDGGVRSARADSVRRANRQEGSRDPSWNWGVIAGQVPYLSGGFQSGIGAAANGDLIETDQLVTSRQTERSGSGIVAYRMTKRFVFTINMPVSVSAR